MCDTSAHGAYFKIQVDPPTMSGPLRKQGVCVYLESLLKSDTSEHQQPGRCFAHKRFGLDTCLPASANAPSQKPSRADNMGLASMVCVEKIPHSSLRHDKGKYNLILRRSEIGYMGHTVLSCRMGRNNVSGCAGRVHITRHARTA